MSTSAIRLIGVTKAFEGHVAVSNLDIDIPTGSLFGLLGPNGAGKTTTLRMVMGVLAPDSGTVEILGRPSSGALRDRIGYMPEERGLYPRMVLDEQLVFLAEIKGCPAATARARIPAWLERMGLAAWAKKKVNELSKGMQQKAQFVATVLHDPEILILDEPMSGLDPMGDSLMRDVLLDLREKGKTIVLSSHQMETVERLCDSIALINRGEKVLEGRVAAVKKNHGRNSVVLAFQGDGSFLAGLPDVLGVSNDGHFAEIQLGAGADPQRLLREVASRLTVSRFEIVEPSLRDIFVAQVTSHSARLPS